LIFTDDTLEEKLKNDVEISKYEKSKAVNSSLSCGEGCDRSQIDGVFVNMTNGSEQKVDKKMYNYSVLTKNIYALVDVNYFVKSYQNTDVRSYVNNGAKSS
jgi:hypothetical protein